MKIPRMIAVCSALVIVAGCTTPGLDRTHEHVTEYSAITKGMTRQQVEHRLGRPRFTDRTGVVHWKYSRPRGTTAQFVELDVRFDDAGRVASTQMRSGVDRFPEIRDPHQEAPGEAYRPDWQPLGR